MRRVELAAIVGLALGAGACKSGVEESMTASADGGESSSTAVGTSADDDDDDDDASASIGTEESGEPPATTSEDDGPTEDGTSNGDASDDEDTSSAEDEDSTGEPVVCEELDAEGCDAASGDCMAIFASPFEPTTGSNYCIGEAEFVACADVAECKEGEFIRCDLGHEAWFLTTSCAPEDWIECEEPGNGHAGECG